MPDQFLKTVVGSRDVSLAIAQDIDELYDLAKSLEVAGFMRALSASELTGMTKAYIILDEATHKDIYDFVVQYPTGQIEIFDKTTMRADVYSPNFTESGYVILTDKVYLLRVEQEGYNFRLATGATYQKN